MPAAGTTRTRTETAGRAQGRAFTGLLLSSLPGVYRPVLPWARQAHHRTCSGAVGALDGAYGGAHPLLLLLLHPPDRKPAHARGAGAPWRAAGSTLPPAQPRGISSRGAGEGAARACVIIGGPRVLELRKLLVQLPDLAVRRDERRVGGRHARGDETAPAYHGGLGICPRSPWAGGCQARAAWTARGA